MPDFGAGAWISGLFHVEQLNGDCFIPDDLRGFVKWKNMWRIGTFAIYWTPWLLFTWLWNCLARSLDPTT